jgi:hypothetical protein
MSSYSFIVKTAPRRGFSADEAADYIGNKSIFERMLRHGWLAPSHQGHKQTLFDLRDLDAVFDRLKKEELPE